MRKTTRVATSTVVVSLGFALVLGACAHQAKQPSPAPVLEEQALALKQKPKRCGNGKPLRIHFYDVGQALSALVTFPDGKHWLIDAGTGVDGGNQKLLDSLTADLPTKEIDLMWITHQHADHNNVAVKILNKFIVKTYVDNGLKSAAHDLAITKKIYRNSTDVLLKPSSPIIVGAFLPSGPVASCASNPNNCSIGLRIEYCQSSVLFVGDAESEEEKLFQTNKPVTLLQVGHHGSSTSSTKEFISALKPKYAVISVGKPREGTNKTYCHPNLKTVQTLNTVIPKGKKQKPIEAFSGDDCDKLMKADWTTIPANETIYETARDGDVILETVGDAKFTRVNP